MIETFEDAKYVIENDFLYTDEEVKAAWDFIYNN